MSTGVGHGRRVLALWAAATGLALALLTIERALLDVRFRPDGVETSAHAYLEGLRFDAASVAYVLLPALLVTAVLPRFTRGAITAAFGALALLCLVEIHFFDEFHRRLDFLLLEYLDDPGTAVGMAFEHVGVLRAAAEIAATAAVVIAMRRVLPRVAGNAQRGSGAWAARGAVLVALGIAARGGLGRPLRPQDVTSGPDHFHRQLALSGPFTLVRHAYEAWRDGAGAPDYGVADSPATRTIARSVFAAPGEVFLDDDVPAWRSVPARETPWHNVVMVVLESFAGRHVGALGAADSWTPQLDRHATRGVTFTRFLANGPSTNRGLPALVAGIPSFPRRTALTKSMEGQQPFLTLGRIVSEGAGRAAFLTAGAATWENLGGWCGGQGFATVIDADDYTEEPLSVWGVADETLLDRVLVECDRMAADGTFCTVALTSSNHPPFAVPADFAPEIDDARERAFRYADHALGAFLDSALARDWARDTVFVVVGDHGLHERARADLDPERYHVPLVLLDGGAAPRAPLTPRREDHVAAQVDVLPTVLGLLGGGVAHAAWGRDLLNPAAVPGIAVLGPHGGAPLVAVADDEGRFVVVPLGHDAPRAYVWDARADALQPTEPDGDALALAATARAYLATAHRAVLERRAAPPTTR